MVKVLFKFILLFMSIVFSNNLNTQIEDVENAVNVNDYYAKMFKDLQKEQSESHLKELYLSLNHSYAPQYLARQQVFNIVYLWHSIRQACLPILAHKIFLDEGFHNNFDDLVSHHILHQQKNASNFYYHSKYVLNKHQDKVCINTFSESIFESKNINFTALEETELNVTYIEKVVLLLWRLYKNNESDTIAELIKSGDVLVDDENKYLNQYKLNKYIVTERDNHFSWPYICSKSLSPTESNSSHAYCILIDAPEEDEKIQGYLKYGFIDSLEKLNFFDAGNSKFFINLENMLSVLSDSINVIILKINARFDFKGFEYLQFAIFYFVFILVTLRFLYQFFDKGESEYNGFRKYYFLLFIYYIILSSQYSDQDSDGLILYLYDLLNQIIWNIMDFVLELISANSNDSDDIFYNFSPKANTITSTEELKVLCLKELYKWYWRSSAIYIVFFIIALVFFCYTGGLVKILDVFNPSRPLHWIVMIQCYSILGLVFMTLLDYYFYIYYSFLLSALISLIPIVIAFDNLPHFNNILRRWFVLVLENIFLFIVFVIMYYALLIFAYLLISDNLLYSLLQLDLFSDDIAVDATGFVKAAFDPNNMDIDRLSKIIIDDDAVDSIRGVIKGMLTMGNNVGEWIANKGEWIANKLAWAGHWIDWVEGKVEKALKVVIDWIREALHPVLLDLLDKFEEAFTEWIRSLDIKISNVFEGMPKWALKMVSIIFGFLGLYYIVVYGLFPCESPIKSTIQKFTRQFVSDS